MSGQQQRLCVITSLPCSVDVILENPEHVCLTLHARPCAVSVLVLVYLVQHHFCMVGLRVTKNAEKKIPLIDEIKKIITEI